MRAVPGIVSVSISVPGDEARAEALRASVVLFIVAARDVTTRRIDNIITQYAAHQSRVRVESSRAAPYDETTSFRVLPVSSRAPSCSALLRYKHSSDSTHSAAAVAVAGLRASSFICSLWFVSCFCRTVVCLQLLWCRREASIHSQATLPASGFLRDKNFNRFVALGVKPMCERASERSLRHLDR